MGSESQLTYQRILDIADELTTLKGEMTTLLEDEVRNQYERIANDSKTVWEGDAAVEARGQFNSLMATFEQFEKAIEDQYTWLRGAVANYQAVDKAAQAGING